MKLRIIRKINKVLNSFSIITLAIGTISILGVAKDASDLWAGITLGLIFFGLLTLLASWLIINFKTIVLNKIDIERLVINSDSTIEEIKDLNDIEYLGNWLELLDGTKYEVDRTQILELKKIIQFNKIEIIKTKQKFYNISPRELLKSIINLGP